MAEICITVYGEEKSVAAGTKLEEVARAYGREEKGDIVLAFVDDRLCELHCELTKSATVKFVTTGETIGNQTYRRSATLLMLKAFDDVLGKETVDRIRVMYSVSKGYYCELDAGDIKVSQELLNRVKNQMKALSLADIPIKKETLNTDEVIRRFRENDMPDKERLFKYRRVSKANIYSICDYEDYYYGYMVPSTGYIKYFDLFLYGDGFVLQMPIEENPRVVPKFAPQKKLFQVLKQSDEWSRMLDVDTVGALNDVIAQGKMNELILIQEALQEKYLAEIATRIVKEKKRIILIAGPSSSGKTTLSHRLSIQLRAHGLRPHPIAMDNYFVNRELTPRDADGNYDFECLGAMDIQKFNEDINALLDGKRVEIPYFNFQNGQREYRGDFMQIGETDVLVIEGIHGLNKKLTADISDESKFKIYISALTQLNIDEHNRIPTTDGRLIRRIVRDAKTRNKNAQGTIAMWNSVRRGEEQNIFPYQEEADVMFNSALIYELSVIKQYAEPLLFAVPKESAEYQEAKRLLKFLDYFLGIGSENIPKNSILREFVGESCFDV